MMLPASPGSFVRPIYQQSQKKTPFREQIRTLKGGWTGFWVIFFEPQLPTQNEDLRVSESAFALKDKDRTYYFRHINPHAINSYVSVPFLYLLRPPGISRISEPIREDCLETPLVSINHFGGSRRTNPGQTSPM